VADIDLYMLKLATVSACAELSLWMTSALGEPVVEAAPAPSPGSERHYCTQYGPFFIRFDAEKAAGVFAILTNGDLGSMVGALEGNTMAGEWIEVDSRGAIRLFFSDDWNRFDATYNLTDDRQTWHGDWTGHVRPEGEARFIRDGIEFRCE
jgi:hypothetical protein